jgi:glycosyltransferase involved in cell wall biosynthesis
MPDEIVLSVVIPVFKAGKKLEATLASVLYDESRAIEVIVVDGGPPEETIETLRPYKNRVRLISEPDKGIYDAMNKGIAASTGRFLYFLGAGDLVYRKGMNVMWRRLTQCAENIPVVFYGDVYWRPKSIRYDGKFSKAKLAQKNICHQAIIYAREVFAKHGLYDLQYPILSDHEFNIRCFADPGIPKQFVNTVLADYEAVGASTTPDRVFIKQRWRLVKSLGPLAVISFIFFKLYSGVQRRLARLLAPVFGREHE